MFGVDLTPDGMFARAKLRTKHTSSRSKASDVLVYIDRELLIVDRSKAFGDTTTHPVI